MTTNPVRFRAILSGEPGTELIDTAEAAKLCGCSTDNITLLVRDERFVQAFRGPRRALLFRRADVNRWLDNGRKP